MREPHRIRGLDGLRAIAITLVFFGHATKPGHVFDFGSTGVHVFFVLSGFLIIGILSSQRRRIEAGTTSFSEALKRFLIRRSLRIFPVYYLFVAAIAAVGVPMAAVWATPDRLLAMVTYTTNFVAWRWWPDTMSHLWSLAVEEQFYLLAAPLFLLLPYRKGPLACVVTIIVGAVVGIVLALNGRGFIRIYMDPLVNFGLMAVGALLSYSVRPKSGTAATRPFLAMAAFIAVALGVHVSDPMGVPTLPISFLAPTLAAAWLIGEIVSNQESLLTRALDCWPLRAFGRISYGFYLFHPVLIVPSSFDGALAVIGLHVHVPVPIPQILEFVGTIVLASLSWNLLEKPIQKLGQRRPTETEMLEQATAS